MEGTKPRTLKEYNKKPNKTVNKENVTVQKTPLGQKVKDVVLDDEAKNVGKYILYDVFIPTLKDTIFNMVTGALNLTFYGDSGNSRPGSSGGFFDYGKTAKNHNTRTETVVNNRSINKISFKYKQDALDILDYLQTEIVEYQQVTVAAFYEMCGVRVKLVDHEYGWTDLGRVIVKRAGAEGFYLDLPKPEKL